MAALLVNKSFQVFVTVLAAIGAITALLVAGTISDAAGTNLLYVVIGFGLGVPVTPAASPAPATLPAPVVGVPPVP